MALVIIAACAAPSYVLAFVALYRAHRAYRIVTGQEARP